MKGKKSNIPLDKQTSERSGDTLRLVFQQAWFGPAMLVGLFIIILGLLLWLMQGHTLLDTIFLGLLCVTLAIGMAWGMWTLKRDITKRKQVEEALRESEERFRTVADFTYDWEQWIGPDGHCIYVSPSCQRITGYPPTEFQSDSELLKTITHPDDWTIIAQHLAEELESQEAIALDFRIITRSGQPRWIGHICQPVYSNDGYYLGRRISNRDITKRKQMEATLRASEETYRQMFQVHQTVKLLLDPNSGAIIDANMAAQNFYGYPLEQLKTMKIMDINTLSPGQIAYEMKQAELEKRNHFWFKHRLASGEIRDVEVHSVPINVQGRRLLYSIIHDITERNRMEAELRKLSSVVEQTADLVFITDKRGIIEYVNPAFEKLTGYTKPEALGQSPRILKSDQHAPRFFQELWKTILAGQVYRGVIINKKKNGGLFYEEKTITPIKNLPGTITHFVSIGKDITERKQAEGDLRQRNRELALLNRANQALISTLDVDQVFTTILEEIRNLLKVAACSVWLVDPETNELVCQQATNSRNESIRGWRLPPEQGVVGWVAHHNQHLIVPDTRTDKRHFKGVDQKIGIEMRSILSVPLRVKQEVIGALQVVDTVIDRFNTSDLTLLESLAATAAIAIENARLYEQAWRDAETKAVLLNEVNHRVKNNLAAIIGLLYTERRHIGMANQAVHQSIMRALINRVQGLATVHSMLSDSKWTPLLLSELARQIIQSALQMLPSVKHVSVDVIPSPVRVTSDQAHNLALVINELATNTIKHVLVEYDTTHIMVCISVKDDTVLFEFRDDGPGYPENILASDQRRHSVGFELIQNVVRRGLHGELSLYNDHGAVTIIQFKAEEMIHSKP